MIIECSMKEFQSSMLVIRHILHITAEELGAKIGVTRQTINFLESGKHQMTLTQFLALKYVFEHELEISEGTERLINMAFITVGKES